MIIQSNNPESERETGDNIESSDLREFDAIIQFKIVYWGPGESGKTTNFIRLREMFYNTRLTRGYSVETTDGRTLWQDSLFLSLSLNIKDTKLKIIAQIVTCTGQERFLTTREYVLDGADGIVFVGDSDPEKTEQNKRSFRELLSFARPKEIPYVIQLNKRDLKNAIPIKEFKIQLGLPLEESFDGKLVVYPAEASTGKQIKECFQDVMLQVILDYFRE